MERRAPLQRKTSLRPIRKEPRRSGRVRDRAYLEWLHGLPCYVVIWRAQEWERILAISNPEERASEFEEWHKLGPLAKCWGPPTADHVGPRPLGRKCSDRETICLCFSHHMDRQSYRGLWRGYGAGAMRAYNARALEWTQRMRHQFDNPEESLP